MQPNYNRQSYDLPDKSPGNAPEANDEGQNMRMKYYLFYLLSFLKNL